MLALVHFTVSSQFAAGLFDGADRDRCKSTRPRNTSKDVKKHVSLVHTLLEICKNKQMRAVNPKHRCGDVVVSGNCMTSVVVMT